MVPSFMVTQAWIELVALATEPICPVAYATAL
jgi:hypothetical protein